MDTNVSPEKVKRTRPDRVAKLEARKTQSETVVKSCLLKHIIGSKEHKHTIQDAFAERVCSFSRRIHNASLALSGIVKYLFSNVESDQLYNTPMVDVLNVTFLRQLILGSRTNPIIDAFLNKFPELHDITSKRHYGDRNIYSFGATKYATNFSNSLRMNLDKTMRHILKQYQVENEWSVEQRTLTLFKICGWKIKRNYSFANAEQTSEINSIVKMHRGILGLDGDDFISERWLKNKTNQLNIIKYFVYINRERKQRDLKLLNIVPIAKIKSHFVTIDTYGLYGVLKELKIYKGNEEDFRVFGNDQWGSIFNIKKLKGKNKTFAGTIDTDGILVCTHFLREKNESDLFEGDDYKIKESDRVIGIDPGRQNIFYGAEKINDRVKTYKLTRRQYYQESGIFKARDQTNNWLSKLQNTLQEMSTVSTKGESITDHRRFVDVYMKHKDALWNELTMEKWSRQRMTLYGGKKKTFAKFFNKIKDVDKERNVIIAYGSAKFASGGKNEISVPTSSAFKECRYRFRTLVIDEFRTTAVHYEDDSILQKVCKKGTNIPVRGLLWCNSTIKSKFVNRDKNAALNILRCANFLNRPVALTRVPNLPRINETIGKRIIVKCRIGVKSGVSLGSGFGSPYTPFILSVP